MAKLGTLSWLERTGGKLTWHDRLTMIATGLSPLSIAIALLQNNFFAYTNNQGII